MEAKELLEIHKLLWRDEPPARIEFEGDTYDVTVLNTNSRKFRSVTIGHRLIITQNLAKPTANSSWVKAAKGRKLTWVIVNDQYLGKVTSEVRYVHDESADIWIHLVYKLNPERIVYNVEEEDPN